ncbi:MAG: cohesin domain-containing protein [Candidatus Cloacimonetes bacterium]|nr:cohesin domain-containing protein [Candidatus Cloacimonadota bacterium]
MKKVVFIAGLLLIASLLAADIRDISIDGGNYTATVGDTIRIYVNANDITEDMRVIAFQFDAYYDSEILQYINHKPGDLFENAMLMANGQEAGLIKVACSHYQPQKGNGTLVELIFIAKTIGDTHLQFDKFKMNSDIMTQVYDAAIKVLPPNTKK